MTSPGIVPRGAIKAFRAFLNETCADGPKHKERRYEQKTRAYGDYLYAQDRERFDVELADALAGKTEGFRWVTCACGRGFDAGSVDITMCGRCLVGSIKSISTVAP